MRNTRTSRRLGAAIKASGPAITAAPVAHLDRAAQLLEELQGLWQHGGVTDEQREALVHEVFHRIAIDGQEFASIEPKPAYVPLFATMVADKKLGIVRWSLPRLHHKLHQAAFESR